jgi:hypothetical protein
MSYLNDGINVSKRSEMGWGQADVAKYIQENYSAEGFEYSAEGSDGIVWVSVPPLVKNIHTIISDISNLPNVIAVDSEVDGRDMRLKVIMGDKKPDTTSVIILPTGMLNMFQKYISSTSVLVVLGAVFSFVYFNTILKKADEYYMMWSDN